MYGKINQYPDPAQFDGDLIPREKISAKNGRVVRMKYEIGDEDAEPIIISESYAKSLTSPEIKCDKVTGRKGREDFNFDGDTFTKFVLDVYPAAKKDLYIRQRLAALHGAKIDKHWLEDCYISLPPRISPFGAKRLSTKPILPPKATIKKPTGFKPGAIYFDENPWYTSTYQWDDRKFWENHTVAEFIMFAEYVDVIYGWRKSLHREKESYSVRLNPIQELVFDAFDIYLIADMRVVIENAMNEGLLDVNLYESMSFGFYNLVKFIYHIPRYSRGGKW